MYLDFFNLKERPFHITPDPDFLYLSPYHKEALGVMIYGVEQRKGFIAVIGEVGLGKTTLIRTYLKKYIHEKLKTIIIFNVNVSFKSIIKTIYKELDIKLVSDDITELIENLFLILIKEFQDGFNIVLLIDEAQNMPSETLEQLRMLSNLETSKDKLIQILLVGQPELEEKLQKINLRQLKQRIAVKATLYPLSKKQSRDYIQHRLIYASNDNYIPVFKNNALKQVVKLSKGIPRNINIICDNALVSAFGHEKKPVTKKIVNEIFKDLNPKEHTKKRKRVLVLICVLIFTLIIAGFSTTWLYQKNAIINIYHDLKQSILTNIYQKKPEKSFENKNSETVSDNKHYILQPVKKSQTDKLKITKPNELEKVQADKLEKTKPNELEKVQADKLEKTEPNELKKSKPNVDKISVKTKSITKKKISEKKIPVYKIKKKIKSKVKPKSKSKPKPKLNREPDPADLIEFLLEKYSDKNIKKELQQP